MLLSVLMHPMVFPHTQQKKSGQKTNLHQTFSIPILPFFVHSSCIHLYLGFGFYESSLLLSLLKRSFQNVIHTFFTMQSLLTHRRWQPQHDPFLILMIPVDAVFMTCRCFFLIFLLRFFFLLLVAFEYQSK